MAALVSPNQMIAAGTQATDGRLCSPLTIGPIAARSHRLLHIARPSSVPITSDSANPTAPRDRLVQIASAARPSCTVCQNVCATSAGPGSAYDGLSFATYASCQAPTSAARKSSGGSTDRARRRPAEGPAGGASDVSSSSSPATTARSSVRFGACRSVAMAADLLVQLGGDLRGERADRRGFDGARVADVDLPLPHDPAGP